MFAGIDHIAVAAYDLAGLAGMYERLGFLLTPLSRHAGRPRPDDEGGQPAIGGTGNRCAMLRQGYLEFLGILDMAADTRGLPELIDRHCGLHILALASADPDGDQRRLGETGIHATLAHLNRQVMLDGRAQTARFTQIRADAAMPEARIFGIRHETPDLVWLPGYLDHPNGAVALEDVLIAVPDLPEARERYARFTGAAPRADGDLVRFHLPAGSITLATPAAAAQRVPGLPLHPNGQALAFTIAVRDLDEAARLLTTNAVPFRAESHQLAIDPRHAGNAGCIFTQHR